MKLDDLRDLERVQREFARSHGQKAVSGGAVVDTRPIYADLNLPQDFGVHRRDAPLSLLCLMYPTVVVFVPPTSAALFEARFGISIESFIELQDRGLVKPLIGHPTAYANLSHLDPILQRRPASVWARGDELAHAFANAAEYWIDARRVVPTNKIKNVGWVREKWRRQYPSFNSRELSDRIVTEVCTNYVDLRIFGHHDIAEWILSLESPGAIAGNLLLMNEFLTYPQLLGIGGTVNFGVEDPVLRDRVTGIPLLPIPRKDVGQSANILLNSMSLAFPKTTSVDTLVQLHQSNIGVELRAAIQAFEVELRDTTPDHDVKHLADKTHHAEEIIQKSLSEARSISYELARGRTQQNVNLSLKSATVAGIAGIVFGVAELAHLPGPAAALTALSLGISATNFLARPPFETLFDKAQRKITDSQMMKRFSPLATHLWWVDKTRKSAK